MAMVLTSGCRCSIATLPAGLELRAVTTRPLGSRLTMSSDTSRPSNCSLKKVGGVERVRHPTLASVKRSNESTINSTTKESPIQVREGRPSFRIMAEGNMWLLEFEASGLRVLADPWLFGNQTFWDQAWLYTGRSQSQQRDGLPGDLTLEYVNSIDAIIITQEWEDHCHLPTLKMLRKDVPVLASPKAAVVVQRLGFTDVTDLAHGTSSQISGLKVWATVGGRVGPPWALRENGFVLQEMQTGLRLGTCCGVHTKGLGLPSLRISTSSECTKHCKDVIGETLMLCRIYYEPHCSFDEESVRSVSPVDVVITPGRQYKVAGFPLTESVNEAVRLLRILKPQVIIPIQLTHLEMSGVTAPIIQLIGTPNDFEAYLREAGITARVVVPPLSGHFEHVQLELQKQDA
nr:uncharacterized protein LOC112278406 isoform X3 [Physcomitrium patens]|eukprot:XP_024367630.1 uncharacterized protein LOC112278406 isoform X3 [Physcomitrella patens]